MPALSTFQLPLDPSGPPAGYGLAERDISAISTTTAFNTGIDDRDTFLGKPRCIVCGHDDADGLQHCHIIGQGENRYWNELKARGWIPQQAKKEPKHEPRDGILMCGTHHNGFDNRAYFIRYFPGPGKFVFVNYAGIPGYQQFHGKAVALDLKHRYSTFPSLFILHELRVRGYHPFQPIDPDLPDDLPFQDWILSDGVLDSNADSVSFNRKHPSSNVDGSHASQHQLQRMPTITASGSTSQSRRTAALTENVITDILAATRASPSWKACVVEGTPWTGTAAENIEKYISSVGLEDQ